MEKCFNHSKINILITSAGRRVSLVESFQKEILEYGMDSKVYTADANPEYSAACNISDRYFKVKLLSDPDYIADLLKICLEFEIKLVIPTIDTELALLALNAEMFRQLGVNVLISEIKLVNICRDKRLTHKLFIDLGIDVAKQYDKIKPIFPLFIKPYDGSCSIDTYKITTREMLTEYHFTNDKLLFLEYVDPNEHTEFTIDLYYDKLSNLKCIVPRERIEVRSGEVNKGITRKNFLVDFIKARLLNLEGARGCITLQAFVNNTNNRVIGIEINPRFGGGYPLSYLAGANFSKWIIDEYLLNKEIDSFNDWEDNLLMLRYDNEILVHDFKA